jgi:hypothetical protein
LFQQLPKWLKECIRLEDAVIGHSWYLAPSSHQNGLGLLLAACLIPYREEDSHHIDLLQIAPVYVGYPVMETQYVTRDGVTVDCLSILKDDLTSEFIHRLDRFGIIIPDSLQIFVPKEFYELGIIPTFTVEEEEE